MAPVVARSMIRSQSNIPDASIVSSTIASASSSMTPTSLSRRAAPTNEAAASGQSVSFDHVDTAPTSSSATTSGPMRGWETRRHIVEPQTRPLRCTWDCRSLGQVRSTERSRIPSSQRSDRPIPSARIGSGLWIMAKVSATLVERAGGPVQTQLVGLHPHAARHLPDERVAILVHDHIDVMAEVVPVIRDTEAEVPHAVVVEVTEECIGEREVGEHPDWFFEVKAKVDVGPLGELVQVKVDLPLGERVVVSPFCWRVEIVSGRARLGLRRPLQARPLTEGPWVDAPGLTGANFAVNTGEVLVE